MHTNSDSDKLAVLGVLAHQGTWKVYNKDSFRSFADGKFQTGTETEAIHTARFIISAAIKLGLEYSVIVTRKFSKQSKAWVKGWDSNKARVSNPYHTLFFLARGRDCDGMYWSETYSFDDIDEAVKEMHEVMCSAEGPTSFCTINREDFEQHYYVDNRDRYAEAMG
jgi:hypothetical protein